MHNLFSGTGFTLREHRLLRLEQAPGLRNQIQTEIGADLQYMDKEFREILEQRLARTGVNLSPDRSAAVERQRQTIIHRLNTVRDMQFDNQQAYTTERNRIVDQVHSILSYAEFQASQQQDLREQPDAAPLPFERQTEGNTQQVWIEGDPQSRFEFAYVRQTPGVARLVGTIAIRPDTVSSSMAGCFRFDRVTHEGRHYFVVSAAPSFDGTFTFIHNGRRATVDFNPNARQEEQERQQRLPTEEPLPPIRAFEEIQADRQGRTAELELLRKRFQTIVSGLSALLTEQGTLSAELAAATPPSAARSGEIGARLEQIGKERAALREQREKLDPEIERVDADLTIIEGEYRDVRERQQYAQITNPRTRLVYRYLMNQPREWHPVPAERGGTANTEYRIMPDGVLFQRRQGQTESPTAVITH